MNARLSISSPHRERELSELTGQMLEEKQVAESRMLALRLAQRWLGTDCNFWVKEPRCLRPLTPADEPLLGTVNAIDMTKLGEAVATQRLHNPFIHRALTAKVDTVFYPTEVLTKKGWSGNPFRTEVCVPIGAAVMMAVEVDEEPDRMEAMFVMIAGRENRDFSAVERYWFERIKWMAQPVIQYLRQKEVCAAFADTYQRRSLVADLPLTPREREVFHWMVQGKRNKEIGIILDCSLSTIKKHVASILSKTGAETRTGAMRAWMKD